MTDDAAAILALLNAQPQLAGKVYDARVPVDPITLKPPARPYVVLYAQAPHATVYNLTGVSGMTDAVHQTTVVGDEADSVRIIQAYVKTALLDVAPAITGRLSFPIRHDYSNPVRRDDDIQPPAMYATDGWQLYTVPSS